jgi:outer membrane protein
MTQVRFASTRVAVLLTAIIAIESASADAPPTSVGPATAVTDELLVARAVAVSEEVRLAEITTQESKVQLTQARAMRGPQISGSLDFSYLTDPIDPIVIRAGELGAYPLAGVPTPMPPEDLRVYDGMEPTVFRLSGVLEQPLFTWGKLNLGVELAEEALTLSTISAGQTRFELELQVRTVAAVVRHLAMMVTITERQSALSTQLVGLVQSAVDAGVSIRTDLLEAQVGSSRAELATREIATELSSRLVTLRRLTGWPELEAYNLGGPRFCPEDLADGTGLILPSIDHLVSAAMENNPGLAMLDQAQVTAAVRTALAQTTQTRRPDFGLRLELTLEGPRIPLEPDWFGQDEFNLTASIGLQSTFYDGGILAGDSALAELDEESLQVQLASAAASLEAEVRQTVLDIELALARMEYLAANEGLLEEKLATRQREFDAGVGSRDGIVRAELAIEANRLQMEEELTQLESRVAALEVLTGERLQ